MKFVRRSIVSLVAAALLLSAASVYSVAVLAEQKERSAHAQKPRKFHYVCPMHPDVTSKKPGTCPKCKMKLVRKAIVK